MADLTITTTQVGLADANTVTVRGTSGGAITIGQVVSVNGSGQIVPTNGTDATLGVNVVGIALTNTTAANQSVIYATAGNLLLGTTPALVTGETYMASGRTAPVGGIDTVTDFDTSSAGTWYATVLGVAISSTVLKLGLLASGQKR